MDTGILYSAVARAGVILVSCQRGIGNNELDVDNFLPNITVDRNTKACYVSGPYTYHILVEDMLIYICAAETAFGLQAPFAFLNEIKSKFTSGSLAIRALMASEHEFDRDFSSILRDQMIKYSSGVAIDGIGKVKKEIDDVMLVMNDNIAKVVDRGERLESLLDKTNELEVRSSQFHTTSRKVRRHMWFKNIKMWIILIVVASVIITLIILMATNVIPVRTS